MCKSVCAQKIAKASVTSCFFLLVSPFSYCHIFASSHLNLITSSHLQMFTPFISSHHTSSHLPIFSYPSISFYACLIHLHLLSFRHLHIFPSQLHISLYSSSLSGHPSSSCFLVESLTMERLNMLVSTIQNFKLSVKQSEINCYVSPIWGS